MRMMMHSFACVEWTVTILLLSLFLGGNCVYILRTLAAPEGWVQVGEHVVPVYVWSSFIGRQNVSERDVVSDVLWFSINEQATFCALFANGGVPDWTGKTVFLDRSMKTGCDYTTLGGMENLLRLCASGGTIVSLDVKNTQLVHDGTFFEQAQDRDGCVLVTAATVLSTDADFFSNRQQNLGAMNRSMEVVPYSVETDDWVNYMAGYALACIGFWHTVLRPLLIVRWRFLVRHEKKNAFVMAAVFPLVAIFSVSLWECSSQLQHPVLPIPAAALWVRFTKFIGTGVGVDFFSLALYAEIEGMMSTGQTLSDKRYIALLCFIGGLIITVDVVFNASLPHVPGISGYTGNIVFIFSLAQILVVVLALRATTRVKRLLREMASFASSGASGVGSSDGSVRDSKKGTSSKTKTDIFKRLADKISFWLGMSLIAAAVNVASFLGFALLTGASDLAFTLFTYTFYHLSVILMRITQIKVFEPLDFDPTGRIQGKRGRQRISPAHGSAMSSAIVQSS